MIRIKDLYFEFKPKQPLFSDLSLETTPGTIYGLFGLNGAGKTSLLKLMAGLLFPQSGSCELAGINVQKRMPPTLSELILLPEQFELPSMLAQDYVTLYAPFYPRFDGQQFLDLMAHFDLKGDEKLQTLSFGQQKKFMIAFALAANTRLLLLDEPTNGLDIPGKSQFRKALATSNTDERCVIISTHQVRDLGQTMDHVIILHEGAVLLNSGLQDIMQHLSTVHLPEKEATRTLYAEPVLGGVKGIIPTAELSDTMELEFDMELFFNAAARRPEVIRKHIAEEVNA